MTRVRGWVGCAVWMMAALTGWSAPAGKDKAPAEVITPKIGMLTQLWFRHNLQDNAEFLMRRAELSVKGQGKDMDIVMTMDPVSVPTYLLQDLYIRYRVSDLLFLQVGQFVIPTTREGRQSSTTLHFVERARLALPSAFGNRRDLGAMFGIAVPEEQWATIGVFNGTGRNTTDVNRGKDYAFRLPAVAWGQSDKNPGRIGVGGSAYAGQDNGGAWFGYGAGEVVLSIQEWSVIAEYGRGFVPTATGVRGTEQDGWYLALLEPEEDRTRLGVRLEQFDPDLSTANDIVRELLLGITWWITSSASFQVNISRYGVGDAWMLDTNRLLVNFQVNL